MPAALPVWNLNDLYPAPTHPSVARDRKKLASTIGTFAKSYQGKIAKSAPATFAKAIAEYEQIQDGLGKLASYAQLLYAGDMLDATIAQFYQNTIEEITQLSGQLLFFTLEINKLADAKMKALLAHKSVAHYQPWLRDVRSFKPYQLADNLEHYILEKSVTEHSWQRLYDESITRLRFTVQGKTLGSAEALDLLSHKDGKKREAAAHEIARVFGENASLFTLITNTLAKSKSIDDHSRGFQAPISSRNVSNQVEDKVVEALITTVERNYTRLSHRYYAWKAKQFGVKSLAYWDRNAPLPNAGDTPIAWDKAQSIVLSAYREFSPKLADVGQKFFDKNWIDVPVREGKSPGAFAHPTVPSAHPYLLVNYQGKIRDVMTLAHELGHGVHQMLSAKQGALMADTPLTLAETASVFGEMLTFQSLLAQQKNAQKRQYLIASKIEDMLNTVVRQIAFCRFETEVHAERKKGELTSERIGKIWMDIQRASFGDAIRIDPEYKSYWMYIPHFIHSPFYVYAYAFGDCLVNSLYANYQSESAKGRGKQFEQKYIALLSAGGTLRHKELLKPFGLDASKPDFWQQGLDVIAGYIDQLD
jgi:oligoendopeptidase F